MTLIHIPAQVPIEKATTSPSGASARGSHRLASAGGGCELMYTLSYYLGMRAKIDPPWRVIGSLVHNMLAYHYGAKLAERPEWLNKPIMEQLVETAGAHQDLIGTAFEVYEAYKKVYAAEPWVPAFVEEEFRATVGELDPGGPWSELDNEIVTCRTDLVIEANGEYWIVDYKCSAGIFNQPRLESWKDDGEYRLHWQAIVNLLILRKRLAPKPVRGFIIQRIKRKTPYDFDRHALRIPTMAYQKAPRALRTFVKKENELLARLDAGEKPTPNFAACQGRYGPCDYINLCAADSESVQNLVWNQDFVQIGGLKDRDRGIRP